MAKVIPIGQPANESERQAIGYLPNHLPGGLRIFHEFEMRQSQKMIERVRQDCEIVIYVNLRRNRRIHDELPLVAEKHKKFPATGEMEI